MKANLTSSSYVERIEGSKPDRVGLSKCETVVGANMSLSIRETESKGRGLYALEDINVGM
jgi:hypothetical protein